MFTPILYRSRCSGRARGESSIHTVRRHGSDWSYIRQYSDHDDARDIVWKKATGDTLYTRERVDMSTFAIIVYIGPTSSGDGFCTERYPISRTESKKTILESLERSAHLGGHPYSVYTDWRSLLSIEPQDTMIIILGVEPDPSWKKISHTNDIIWINLEHIYEAEPTPDIMIDGGVIDRARYLSARQSSKNKQESIIRSIRGQKIQLYTHESVTDVLNHFFKKRIL